MDLQKEGAAAFSTRTTPEAFSKLMAVGASPELSQTHLSEGEVEMC